VAKFALVAAFFMHLKFDSRVFSTFFAGGLVMAVAAFIAVLAMFRAF
jgi:cytochrome c oxidase subunit 4